MNATRVASPPVRPTQTAAHFPQPTPPFDSPEDAFGPQLARACARGIHPAVVTPPRVKVAPVSGLAGTDAISPRVQSMGEKDVPSETSGGSDTATSDEDQSPSSEDDAAVPPLLTENGVAARVMIAPSPPPPPPGNPLPVAAQGKPAPPLPASSDGSSLAGREDATSGSTQGGLVRKPALKTDGTTPAPDDADAPMPTASPGVPKANPSKRPPAHVGEAALAPAFAVGTAGASPSQQMNTAQDMTKTSGLEEQNLPVGPASSAHLAMEEVGPRSVLPSHASPVGDLTGTLSEFVQPAVISGTTRVAEEVAPVSPVDPTAKALALMNSAVVHFRRTGEEDFDVTIHPDADTELLLHVSLQSSGGAEIHAELRQGDGAALVAHWQDLQERLAQQGVKLAALTTGEERAGQFGSHAGFSSPQRQRQPEKEAATLSFASTITTNSHSRPAPVHRGAGRGWETWA